MLKFLSLIYFYLLSASATAPFNATVCAHLLDASAKLPVRLVKAEEISKVLQRLEQNFEFDSTRVTKIRSDLEDPTTQVFYYQITDLNDLEEFLSQLVVRLELTDPLNKTRPLKDKRFVRRSLRLFWRNLIFRNPLLHLDQIYRTARHSDEQVLFELRLMSFAMRAEHFERDYQLHESHGENESGLLRPSPRQGRIDTATYFERLIRKFTGDPFPRNINQNVSIDFFLEDNPHQLTILIRVQNKLAPNIVDN